MEMVKENALDTLVHYGDEIKRQRKRKFLEELKEF